MTSTSVFMTVNNDMPYIQEAEATRVIVAGNSSRLQLAIRGNGSGDAIRSRDVSPVMAGV